MRTRNWSIRSKLTALLLVPLSTLVVLWVFAASTTLGATYNLLTAKTNYEKVCRPAEALVAELQQERQLSLVYLGSGRVQSQPMSEQRARTDAAQTKFRRSVQTSEIRDISTELSTQRINEMITALDGLSKVRQSVDRGELDRTVAMRQYTTVIDSAFRVYNSLARLDDVQLAREMNGLIALTRAREVFAQEDALLSGAAAAGRFAPGEYPQFVQAIGAQRQMFADTVPELPVEDRERYAQMVASDAFTALRKLEDRVVNEGKAGGPVPLDVATWNRTFEPVSAQLRDLELTSAEGTVDRATPVAAAILIRVGLAGVLGLFAVALSIFVSIRMGRSLIERLNGLRDSVLELAGNRLPAVVARLRRGEDVNLETDAPPLSAGADEIGELATAFSQVQCTAVRSAIDEAALRRGMNEVFLNMARRSQALLHRQLSLLDQMERRSTDPEELEDLFRLDHMATRMRRHAEDLVILAGATPGRGWRQPVPAVDIIRGAVSEIEEYSRVDVLPIPDASVIGRAVGDLIHLLAELIENATSFSPPQTRVQISAESVPNGYAIEIEDRGLGICPHVVEDTNKWLANPPEFDPANSARLGLFVVAQLANRNHISVTLRRSPYGGLTAIVLLPPDLVVGHPGAVHGRERMDGVRSSAPISPAPASPAAVGAAPANPALNGTALNGTAPNGAAPASPAPNGAVPVGAPTSGGSPSGRHALGSTPAGLSNSDTAEQPLVASLASGRGAIASAGPRTTQRRTIPRGAGQSTTNGSGPAERVNGRMEGLPKRVRQANLAPKLRSVEQPAAPTESAGPVRSPDQIRSMMSSFQSGTVRGRTEAMAGTDGDLTSGTPSVGPGAASAGQPDVPQSTQSPSTGGQPPVSPPTVRQPTVGSSPDDAPPVPGFTVPTPQPVNGFAPLKPMPIPGFTTPGPQRVTTEPAGNPDLAQTGDGDTERGA